jgi:putative transposase
VLGRCSYSGSCDWDRCQRRDFADAIQDRCPRYLITCDALSTTKETYAFAVFERAFKDCGLPRAIRTDNGVPFASAHALYGLSKLAVWWLRLGIQIERIRPGHPEQNADAMNGCT